MQKIAASQLVEIATEKDAETMLNDFKADVIKTLNLENRTAQHAPWTVNLIFEAEKR